MSMNGIDISDYQSDLDLGAIDFNFAIIKATENTGHVQSCCDSFVQKCKALGKCWGFYHFMGEGDPIEQAKHFVDNTKNYFGEGVPVLDYEMYGRIGTDKAKQFLDYVYAQTGVRCIVYMSRSVYAQKRIGRRSRRIMRYGWRSTPTTTRRATRATRGYPRAASALGTPARSTSTARRGA